MSDYLYFKAHGKVYRSAEEGNARIKEINEEIFVKGVSDGRLTEWLDIEDSMAAAKEREYKRKRDSEAAEWKREAIKQTKHELEMLKLELNGEREYGGHGYMRRIDWIDAEGKRRISRYTTEGGFLRAYLRMIESDLYVIFAE